MNIWLRNALPKLFQTAVARMQTDDQLQTSFYQFIPVASEIEDSFFLPLVESLTKPLRQSQCVLTSDGRWLLPENVLFPPAGAGP